MERFAALGVCHRPLSLRQISTGIISFSRNHRRCGFVYRWERPCFEQRNLVTRRKLAAAACLASPESNDAGEDSGELVEDDNSLRLEGLPMITTTFSLKKKCEFGESFAVVGADPLLGAWDPVSGVAMDWSEDHVWKCQIDLPVGQEYEYKFVLTRKEEVVWQPGPNRTFTTTSTPLVVFDNWDEIGTAAGDDAPTQDELTDEKTAVGTLDEEESATLTDSEELNAGIVADELDHAEMLTLPMAKEDVVMDLVATVADTEVHEPSDSMEDNLETSDVSVQDITTSCTTQLHIEVPEESQEVKNEADQMADLQDGGNQSSSSLEAERSEEDEDGSVTVPKQLEQSKIECTKDVPEDSKGFKSFKFEAALRKSSDEDEAEKKSEAK